MENKQIIALGASLLVVVIAILFFINSSQAPQTSEDISLNNLNLQVTKTPSQSPQVTSLQITDEKIGSGEAVKAGDTISVNYVGALLNGKVFDSTSGKNPFVTEIGVGKVIRGWDEGLLGMKVGGIRKLLIPSDLAYGAQGAGEIPPNSPLIFEIQLISIQSPTPTSSPTTEATPTP